MTIRAARLSGMSVGFVRIVSACHGVPSSGQRIAPPRPQVNPVRGNIREVANKFEVCCVRSAIRAEKAARAVLLDEQLVAGLRAKRKFGVRVGLLENTAPEFQLRCDDRYVRPNGRRGALVPGVKHGSPYAFSAMNVAGKWDSR